MNIESEYVTWVQPILTSNTSYGVVSSTSITSPHEPYCAFDGIKTGEDKYASSSTSGGDITWQLPYNVKISSCKVYTTTETGYLARFPQSITLLASNDGSTWTTVGSASNYSQPTSGGYVTVTVATPAPYTYYKWEFGQTFGSDGGVAIGEIEITATYLKTYVPMKAYLHNNTYNMKVDTTFLSSNIDKNGTTENNGVISGFTSSKYARLPESFSPSSNTWEIYLKIHTPSILRTSTKRGIFEVGKDSLNFGIRIMLSGAKFYTYITTSSETIVNATTPSFTTDTDYWLKVTFNGSMYTASYSTDGSTFSDVINQSSSNIVIVSSDYNDTLGMCHYGLLDEVFSGGTIDLNECYINIGGARWWNGVNTTKTIYAINN